MELEDKNAIFQMRFPQKLWYLLNLRPDAVLWGGTGRTILLNYRILQNYLQCDHSVFKTTNISSFVRQLNLYGFRKVTSHLQDPLCNSSNPYMHEYVHDYFQFGRPELLNKITRKALTIKRNFKPKPFNNVEQLLCLTPLQKARHALRVALKKAAQEILSQDSSKQLFSTQVDYEESQEDMCEEEASFDLDWLPPTNQNAQTNLPPEPAFSAVPKNDDKNNKTNGYTQLSENIKLEESESFGDAAQDNKINLMGFSKDFYQENNYSFSAPFLSMADLDTVPTDAQTGADLLAKFNINCDIDEGLGRKLADNENGSLNCVLPSINYDQNGYVAINENNVNMDQYNGDWDQMFNDMINRSSNQESGSELKELYSQISKTIDLLNS